MNSLLILATAVLFYFIGRYSTKPVEPLEEIVDKFKSSDSGIIRRPTAKQLKRRENTVEQETEEVMEELLEEVL